MPEATTYVYDADGAILGRLASAVADLLQKASRDGREDKVVIVNAEKAIVTGSPVSIMANYHAKYELNHARKGPYFPRMPDMILKRTVRGMLPYQKKSSGRRALRKLPRLLQLRVQPGHPTGVPPQPIGFSVRGGGLSL